MKQIGVRELIACNGLELPAPFVFSDNSIREGISLAGGGVYLFRTEGSKQVLYIGVSNNISRRLSQHIKGRGNKDLHNYMKSHRVEVFVYPEQDLGYQELYESYLILLHNPRFNVGKIYRERL